MNRCFSRRTRRGRVLLPLALGLSLTASAPGQDYSTPLQAVSPEFEGSVRGRLDDAAFSSLKSVHELTMRGFQVSATDRVDLVLRRVKAFAPDARIVVVSPSGEHTLPLPDIAMFAGTVAGQPDSDVFLSFSPSGSNGWIRMGATQYVMSSGRSGGRDTTVFDPSITPAGGLKIEPFVCDTLPGPPEPVVDPSAVPMSRGLPACQTAKLAIETDYEYTGLFGGDEAAATKYVATLFGAATSVYERDVNVKLEIVYLRLWTTPDDPWDQTTIQNQLPQFRNYWNTNMTSVQRHLTHMLSGRSLGGGIAYRPGLCQETWNYSLASHLNGSFPMPLGNNQSPNWDPFVVCHEIGHNFAAPHSHCMSPPIDTCAGTNYDCPNPRVCTTAGTIMSYCHLCSGGTLNVRMEFHARTISEAIIPYLTFSIPCDLSAPCNYPGDCDGNDFVAASDIPCFVGVIVGLNGDPSQAARCDLNGDGIENGADIQLFVETLLAGS